jgi:hypothetical protein
MTEGNPSACVAEAMRPATNRAELSASFDHALEAMSALDLARWLACRSGYVVPAAREP